MKRPAIHVVAILSAVVAVALGGTAAAYLLRGMRDVTTSSNEAHRLYLLGLESEHKLYHREAIAAYAQALALDPTFAMASLRLAGALAARDPDRARSLVKCVTSCTDGLTDREKLIARIYQADLVKRDRKETAALVEEYTTRFPEDAEGLMRKAGLLARDGKDAEALALYERVIRIEPNQAWAYNTLGYAWMARGDFARAEDNLKRYRFLAPDQANPFDSLGELYANTGRYGEAEESLRKALLIKPDFSPATAHLGTVLVGQGRFEEAAREFLRAADAADGIKEKFQWAFPAALCLVDAGKPAEALDAYERLTAGAASLPPDVRREADSELNRLRAILLATAGRSGEARESLERVTPPPAEASAERKRDFEQSMEATRGILASLAGDHEAVVEHLRKALRPFSAGSNGFPYYPYPHRIRIVLARSLQALGRPEEAREALAPILAVNPRFEPALAVLAALPPSTATSS